MKSRRKGDWMRKEEEKSINGSRLIKMREKMRFKGISTRDTL